MSYPILIAELSDFGHRELGRSAALLKAWSENGLPEGFENSRVVIGFDTNSGYVFLANNDCQSAMMNGKVLEEWYTCPECGHEGFLEDMEHGGPGTECARYVEGL